MGVWESVIGYILNRLEFSGSLVLGKMDGIVKVLGCAFFFF